MYDEEISILVRFVNHKLSTSSTFQLHLSHQFMHLFCPPHFLIADLCPEVCPGQYEPVCGTDGSTYPNRCELGREACDNNNNLRALYAGTCVQSKGLVYFILYL